MKRMALAAVAAVWVLGLSLAVFWATGFSVDYAIGRYPGAARSRAHLIDLDYLPRGWISRQAIYITRAERARVEAWYAARYQPAPGATHVSTTCGAFRATRQLLPLDYSVAVSVCTVPAGTRIVVNERVFYSPGPAP